MFTVGARRPQDWGEREEGEDCRGEVYAEVLRVYSVDEDEDEDIKKRENGKEEEDVLKFTSIEKKRRRSLLLDTTDPR